jgi:hypothetical protein
LPEARLPAHIAFLTPSNARVLPIAPPFVLRSRALDLTFEQVDDLIELPGEACQYERYPKGHPHRWLVIQAGQFVDDPRREGYSYSVAPTRVIAFSTRPGEGCEPANFGLCRYPGVIERDDPLRPGRRRRIRTGLAGWSWKSFCKTQYASREDCGGVPHFLRCHLAVVKMLDTAKSLGLLGGVHDEGDFWEKRDVEALARRVGEWNETIAEQVAGLRQWFGGEVLAASDAKPGPEVA